MRDRRGGGSGGGGSSRENKVALAGKSPLSPNEADSDGDYRRDDRREDRHEDRPEDRREDGEGAQQQVSNGGKTKRGSGLARQGSKLWRIMRWNRGEAETEAEEDPAADRRAMKEAIAAGRGHVRHLLGERGWGRREEGEGRGVLDIMHGCSGMTEGGQGEGTGEG